ncbi:hypothetical protein KCTC32516_00583 [Polaribacter huanghezhanensis]|nr:hypothetical protein KCTC32516_00583 [Polaribacter huanghezhanensis]
MSFYIMILALIMVSCENETTLPTNASIDFSKTMHDFGELPLKKEASFVFQFKNDGKELLQIR